MDLSFNYTVECESLSCLIIWLDMDIKKQTKKNLFVFSINCFYLCCSTRFLHSIDLIMGNDEKMVAIATCNDIFSAQVIVSKLCSNGVEAFIRDKTGISYLSSPYASTGDFDVLVLESNLKAAEEIIQ